ncbi:Uncharacterized protein PCOAH_00013530 [Plasmodium coatneyi]|uniref:Uncharacterized protein n=1 Tax=Plasmodium coatneyi TaxID=208452 RepID=A0A1B1DW35_9APIC|nr:Uncharacterized protein PCOAH_00013530 [Plasmodium coatneyi]ANQ06992.1 Uncharacterized protein PCOAH_00013530 [Plasmodium coatneyi]
MRSIIHISFSFLVLLILKREYKLASGRIVSHTLNNLTTGSVGSNCSSDEKGIGEYKACNGDVEVKEDSSRKNVLDAHVGKDGTEEGPLDEQGDKDVVKNEVHEESVNSADLVTPGGDDELNDGEVDGEEVDTEVEDDDEVYTEVMDTDVVNVADAARTSSYNDERGSYYTKNEEEKRRDASTLQGVHEDQVNKNNLVENRGDDNSERFYLHAGREPSPMEEEEENDDDDDDDGDYQIGDDEDAEDEAEEREEAERSVPTSDAKENDLLIEDYKNTNDIKKEASTLVETMISMLDESGDNDEVRMLAQDLIEFFTTDLNTQKGNSP